MKAHVVPQSLADPHPHLPSRLEHFLPRPRLSSLLEGAAASALTIVTGPAGIGKTLAVADWARDGNPAGPVVWVAIGEADRDVERLWETLSRAMTVQLGPDARDGIGITDGRLATMAAMAASNGGVVVLVLDGCEKLAGGASLAVIDALLARPLSGIRVVMTSRHDPALALHGLRLAGHLSEIRFDDLAFTSEEARELLACWQITLTDAALLQLLRATGGWAAALRLAAFSLCRADDPEKQVGNFDDVNFMVSDYIWDEVLGSLDPDVCAFLQVTSVSTRLCGSLAQAISGNPGAHEILRALAREELLVQDLDDSGWYRTHPLLRSVLLRRLRDEDPDLEVRAHRRAAVWFEGRAAPVEAIRHAVATRDWDFAGTVSLRGAAAVVFSPDVGHFADALSAAPPYLTHDHGELAVAQALAASLSTHDECTAAMIQSAAARLPQVRDAHRELATVALRVAEALQAHHTGRAPAAERAATEADATLARMTSADAHTWADARPRVAMMRVGAKLWAGDPEEALHLSHQFSQGQPQEHPAAYSQTYRLGLLAFTEAVLEQRVAQAQTMALTALDLAVPHGRLRSTEAQFAWLALCLTGFVRCDAEMITTSLECAERATAINPNPHISAMLSIIRTRMESCRGNLPAARRRLVVLDKLLATHTGMTLVAGLAVAARVELELACGSVESARAVLERHAVPAGPALDALVLANAWTLLAERSPESARAAVAPLLEKPGSPGATAWLVVSCAEDRMRHDALSIEAFSRALDAAADQGITHPFLQPPPWLPSFLRRHAQVVGSHRAFVEDALVRRGDTQTNATVRGTTELTSLTEREMAVLLHLPGMSSNTEIATALSISANTVKQHLKSTYRKLDVGTRRDAVRVARDRGLLPL